MKLYAQVDRNGVVFAMLKLSGEVERELLIPLTEKEFCKIGIGWRLDGSEWIEPLPVVEALSIDDFMAAQSVFVLAANGVELPMERRVEADNVMARAARMEALADGTEWRVGVWYAEGTIITRNGVNFVAVQGHFSQAIWLPEDIPALWERMREQYAEWIRPTGVHDAYRTGDRFIFNGVVFEVVVDFMVHSPDEFAAGFIVIEN